MRSRYSAFARGEADYLLRTWDASTRPTELELDPDLRWRFLEIVAARGGGPFSDDGVVEFRAHHRSEQGRGVLHEVSRFRRVAGSWYYLDGEVG